MKKIFIFLFVLIYHPVFSQQENGGLFKNYRLLSDVILVRCDNPDGTNDDGSISTRLDKDRRLVVNIDEKGYGKYLFSVLRRLDDGGYVIEFREFNDAAGIGEIKDAAADEDHRLDKKYCYDYDHGKRRKYFVLSAKDLDENAEKYYSIRNGRSLTGGVVMLPMKIRPAVNSGSRSSGGFDFSKDISLGLSIGVKQRISNTRPYFLSLLFSPGIGDIELDSFNTRGHVFHTIDVPSLSLCTGLVLDFKLITFGFFVGTDNVPEKDDANWIYQRKAWYSIGVGFSILSISSQESNRIGGQSR